MMEPIKIGILKGGLISKGRLRNQYRITIIKDRIIGRMQLEMTSKLKEAKILSKVNIFLI